MTRLATAHLVIPLTLLLASPVLAAEAGPVAARPGDDAAVRSEIEAQLDEITRLYMTLHREPELSLSEARTAARVGEALDAAGYAVTTGVGGHGVVAVLENGAGPVVMIRGDMDALPVTEATGLPYASEVRVSGPEGAEVGVMHACGHDVHTANLVGTGRTLAALRARWRGTLVLVGQPAEEVGLGARSMIGDGLFEHFPRPDYVLGLHVGGDLPAGQVGTTAGWWAANVDSVDIILYGRGGHGARPHRSIDPVVAAAHLVTALQTLVSRRVDPLEPAVVTVGSIHGGTKHNVIPDQVELKLTVRSYTDEVRAELQAGIRQLAEGTCATFRCPRPPLVAFKETYTPAAFNDPELTAAATGMFQALLGEQNVLERPAGMGGEDFGMLPRAAGAPGLMFRLGAVAPARYAASMEADGAPLPSLHSSRFAPLPAPTLRTGMRTLSNLALALLGPPSAVPD